MRLGGKTDSETDEVVGDPVMEAAPSASPGSARQGGERICERRQELALSKAEAARRSGLSVETWRKVEDGGFNSRGRWVVADPSATTCAAIDKVLQWPIGSTNSVIMGGEPVLARVQWDEALSALIGEVNANRELILELLEVRTTLARIEAAVERIDGRLPL
jgi:DNA-binding XRE family transcriptional regulator